MMIKHLKRVHYYRHAISFKDIRNKGKIKPSNGTKEDGRGYFCYGFYEAEEHSKALSPESTWHFQPALIRCNYLFLKSMLLSGWKVSRQLPTENREKNRPSLFRHGQGGHSASQTIILKWEIYSKQLDHNWDLSISYHYFYFIFWIYCKNNYFLLNVFEK